MILLGRRLAFAVEVWANKMLRGTWVLNTQESVCRDFRKFEGGEE